MIALFIEDENLTYVLGEYLKMQGWELGNDKPTLTIINDDFPNFLDILKKIIPSQVIIMTTKFDISQYSNYKVLKMPFDLLDLDKFLEMA